MACSADAPLGRGEPGVATEGGDKVLWGGKSRFCRNLRDWEVRCTQLFLRLADAVTSEPVRRRQPRVFLEEREEARL